MFLKLTIIFLYDIYIIINILTQLNLILIFFKRKIEDVLKNDGYGRTIFLFVSLKMAEKSLIVPGRFVILTQGRHAGKKAVILNAYEAGQNNLKYAHALILGIERCPKKLTKGMPQEVLVKRTQVKVFVKTVNVNHLLLTRHLIKSDDDFWKQVKVETVVQSLADLEKKHQNNEKLSEVLRQKYLNNKLTWLFKPLHF